MAVSGLLLVKTKSLSQIQTNCFAALLWRYCFICFTVAVVIRQPPQWCGGAWQLWGGQQPPWAKEICTQLWNPTYERQICKYVELKPFCFGQPLKKKKKVILFLEKLLSLKLIDLFFDMENSVSPYHYCHGAAHSSVLLKYTCHVRPLLTFTQQHFCFTGIAKCSGTLRSSDATGQCYNLCLQTPMQSLLQHLCGHRGQSRHPWSYFCRNVVDTAVIFAIFKPFWESSVRITHCCRIGGGAFM